MRLSNSMKLDHFGFTIFLFSLLIAPKVPLAFAGLAGKSSLSLGVAGFLLWAILCPEHILRRRSWRYSFSIKWLLIFGIYALGVSLASKSPVSILYASQYLFYIWFSAFMMGDYIRRAVKMEQLHITYRIFAMVGLIYALGVIISLWTGPFYPNQTLDTGRLWGGLFIQQGVGFAEGTNGAGTMLIVFCAFFLFIYRDYQQDAWLLGLIAIFALLATISRSSIFSLIFGVIILLIVILVRVIIRRRVLRRTVGSSIKTVLVLILVVGGYFLFLSETENIGYTLTTVAEGFGINDKSGIIEIDKETRVALWTDGLVAWTKFPVVNQLLGQGFRGSIIIVGNAWITPHNAYIAMLGDFGILGIMLFLISLFGGVFKMVYSCLFSGGSNEERAALVIIAGLMMHNMSELFFYSPIVISMIVLMLIFADVQHAPQHQIPCANHLER